MSRDERKARQTRLSEAPKWIQKLHDLRHGALTELASVSPNLPGIAHIAGHKRVSTTTRTSGHRREIGRFEPCCRSANHP